MLSAIAFGEDARVGRNADYREFFDQTLQPPAADQPSTDVVLPDALSEFGKLEERIRRHF